jgi:hypothetical protein
LEHCLLPLGRAVDYPRHARRADRRHLGPELVRSLSLCHACIIRSFS